MPFEDYTLDNLCDCLYDLLNNTDIRTEDVINRIVDTLENNKKELQNRIERVDTILKVIDKRKMTKPTESSEKYDLTDGFEWTPLGVEDKIKFKFANKKDDYDHSDYYWDTDRNR